LKKMPIGVAEFVENQENRCPVVLLLDTSGSMSGEPIKALNDGIKTLIINYWVRMF
jgi:Mg-chelatase subunit ChlD